jgi:hypothetical protein
LSDPEEEPYSIIFASLKHPVRRNILRMLSEKPMTFSEMLDVLKVSSPFLTYHLENLGELVCKAGNGKYRLSAFGDTAVMTMSRVEEMPKPPSSQSNRNTKSRFKTALTILHGAAIIFLIGLAIGLMFSGQYFVNYTTSTTYASSWGPEQLVVHPNQNYTFYLAIDRRPLASYLHPNESNWIVDQYEFSNNNTYWYEDPALARKAPTWWRAISVSLSINASENMYCYGAFLWNESGGTVANPQYYYVEIDAPNSYQFHVNDVTEPCLYGFAVTDLNSSVDMNGTMEFQVEWNLFEKPYFYYGQAELIAAAIGIVIASLYPILEVSDFFWSSRKRSAENRTQLQNLTPAQNTFKGEVLDKQLVAKLSKKYTHPEQALRYWLERKISQGKTREQALKEIEEENA